MSLKMHIIDPVNYTANQRAEFRLPSDGLFLSNLKLLNVGFTSTQQASEGINQMVGSAIVIKNLYLMDGSTVLEQVQGWNIIEGWHRYNVTNNQARDLDSYLKKNNLGREAIVTDYDTGGLEVVITNYFQNAVVAPQPTTDPATTPRAWLDLSDVFQSLRNIGRVSTQLFHNLRVFVEFNTDNAVFQPNQPTYDHTSVQPILVAQEIDDENERQQYMKDFKGVQYSALETDQVRLPAVTTTTDARQSVNFRLNGFNNKRVNRMLVYKSPALTTDYDNLWGNSGSFAQVQQTLQCRVNGVNILPRAGITKDNERLRMLNDTWGSCVTVGGYNIIGLNPDQVDDQSVPNQTGLLDVYGFPVQKMVSDMQVEYSRLNIYDAGAASQPALQPNQALLLNFIGEVNKTIVRVGNSYRVLYS